MRIYYFLFTKKLKDKKLPTEPIACVIHHHVRLLCFTSRTVFLGRNELFCHKLRVHRAMNEVSVSHCFQNSNQPIEAEKSILTFKKDPRIRSKQPPSFEKARKSGSTRHSGYADLGIVSDFCSFEWKVAFEILACQQKSGESQNFSVFCGNAWMTLKNILRYFFLHF